MTTTCCPGGCRENHFGKLVYDISSEIHAGGSRPAFVKAMESPAEIHAAAVRRLAAISASATEFARQGKLSSHEAGVLDHLIGIHGQRLERARPRR